MNRTSSGPPPSPADESLQAAPASVAFRWLHSPHELAEQCRQWLDLPVIGIDTEFVRTRTFFARLGLVQIHAVDTNWLIDPLAVGDLAPLFQVLTCPSVTKIIHSGSEDIEIFNRLGDGELASFFDTQVAAALCGLGPSLSYQALVGELVGIEVDKDQTRSDWLRRPLSDSQKRYAALDVAWLPQVYGQLSDRLLSLGRLDWLNEDCQLMLRRIPAEQVLEDQYQRFKMAWRLKGPQRAALKALLQWREQSARDRDLPRKHVLSDDDLLAIAVNLPADNQSVRALELEHPRAVGRVARSLADRVQVAVAADSFPAAPPEPLDRESKTIVKTLRAAIAKTASGLGLAPEVLCGRREVLHVLQRGRPSARLEGWRLAQLEGPLAPYLDGPVGDAEQ